MILTDLADACRSSGLGIIQVADWQTRGHGQMGSVDGIICHHTAGAATGDYPSLGIVRDGRPGLEGPLSQLGLGRSGTVYVIAAGLAWHAGTGAWSGLSGNWDCIGIEAESTGYGSWTAAQRDAYPRLCAALARWYGVPVEKIIAHREWSPGRKPDPTGIDMGELRARVRQILAGTDVSPDEPPQPEPQPEGDEDDVQFIVNYQGIWLVKGDLSSRTGFSSMADLSAVRKGREAQYPLLTLSEAQMARIPVAGMVKVDLSDEDLAQAAKLNAAEIDALAS